jgi:uncharacterized protein (TIGR00369 family)
MESTLEQLQQTTLGLFPETLGVRFLEASPEHIRAELFVTEQLCTLPGVMHGGAIMAFADTLGAYATVFNLPPGAGTTTLESKTNFFSKAPSQAKVIGDCRPLHRGRRTLVWETQISTEAGKRVATVTQTQIVLAAETTPEQTLAALFASGETRDHQATLATLERSGGGLYRAWAEAEKDAEVRAELLEAAEREDRNAELLERLVGRGGGASE